MNIVLWILQVLLGATFIMAGLMKGFMYERAKVSIAWVKDFPQVVVRFIGVAELLGGLGLILPALTGILRWLTPTAATALAVVMLLATGFHIRRKETQFAAFTFVLTLLAAFVAYGRFVLEPL